MSAETVGAAVRRLAGRFSAVGIDSARLDAELLVARAIGTDRTRVFLAPERALDDGERQTVEELARRRAEGRESVAHLLGVRGFRRLDLQVDRRALIPRPETELLVEVGLTLPVGAAVIDVGTGSGAIALALADERPDLTIHATDVSSEALEVARANAQRLGLHVTLHEGDLLADAPSGYEDLAVLSNPPYVPDDDRDGLPPEVRLHDPPGALFGGPDGLDVVRRLLPAAARAGAGLVAVEIGRGQAQATADLTRSAGFPAVTVLDDLAGIARVVVGRR